MASMGATVALLFLALPFAFSLRRTKEVPSSRYWFVRLAKTLDHRPDQVFFFIPFVLLTSLLAVEMRSGLVTLAWGVEAVAVFLVAIRVQERSFRLAGLGLLLLCVAKIVFRDVWGLAPRDRYLTFIVLGSALLAVSYLYTRYRDVLRQYL
jgi:ribose/xylose/arabinose/galactoside ABC-type transport system permease subunit